jgi:hypothetical protein
MGGFASFLGGAGQAAAPILQQRREQNFQHHENSLKQLQ